MQQKIIDQIQFDIQNLAVKKLWKINENGRKIKVRRDDETAYSIYLDGHFITTLTNREDAFNLINTLLDI